MLVRRGKKHEGKLPFPVIQTQQLLTFCVWYFIPLAPKGQIFTGEVFSFFGHSRLCIWTLFKIWIKIWDIFKTFSLNARAVCTCEYVTIKDMRVKTKLSSIVLLTFLSCWWRLLATPASWDIYNQCPSGGIQPSDKEGHHSCQDETGWASRLCVATCWGLAQQTPPPLDGRHVWPVWPTGTFWPSCPTQAGWGSRWVTAGQGEALVVVLLQLSRPTQTSVAAQAALKGVTVLCSPCSAALPSNSKHPHCSW